jgi:hypothetical protein
MGQPGHRDFVLRVDLNRVNFLRMLRVQAVHAAIDSAAGRVHAFLPPNSMINGTLSSRTVLIATVALLIGWGLGFLMSGTREPGSSVRSASAGSFGQAGNTQDERGAYAIDSLKDSAGDATAFKPVNGGSDPGSQFESLMRGALRISDYTDRMVRLREIARWISVANLPAAVEKAKKLPFSDRWQVMQALGARWAEADPVAAAAYATKMGGNRYGWNDLLSGVIDKWASFDQQAAVGWIEALPSRGRHRIRLLRRNGCSAFRRATNAIVW